MPNEGKKVVQQGGPHKGQERTVTEYKPDYHGSLKKESGKRIPVTYVDDPNSDKRYKVYGSRKEVGTAKKELSKPAQASKSTTAPKTQGSSKTAGKFYKKLKYR